MIKHRTRTMESETTAHITTDVPKKPMCRRDVIRPRAFEKPSQVTGRIHQRLISLCQPNEVPHEHHEVKCAPLSGRTLPRHESGRLEPHRVLLKLEVVTRVVLPQHAPTKFRLVEFGCLHRQVLVNPKATVLCD